MTQVSHLVEAWQPWWLNRECAELQLSKNGMAAERIVELPSGDSKEETRQKSSLPAPPAEPLTALSELISSAPSPLLRWQLFELLYAYSLVMRLYNGDPAVDSEDAACTFLEAAPFLRYRFAQSTIMPT